MADAQEDWPRDVILDLMMHLTRSGFPKSSEHLADALVVYEIERSRRLRSEPGPVRPPVLSVVQGGGTAA